MALRYIPELLFFTAYYLGYGGNHNSTTRFRRYDGDESGITNPKARPAILKEYTDAGHLRKPNHWYHIKITNDSASANVRHPYIPLE